MEAERVVEGRAHPGSRQSRLRRQESAENFPVALRVLPTAVRGHLRAVYDVVRVIDNLGDDPGTPADRLAALEAFGADLATVWTTGRPRDPALVALVPSVRAVGLEQRDLAALVEANVQDQRVTRYRTYEQLRGYCALSANPIGRLVLQVFGVSTPDRVALSDQVCDALQQLEHWQDVAEDLRRGRIYLPAEDLERFGCTLDLDPAGEFADPPDRLAALVRFEADRARSWYAHGYRLVPMLDRRSAACTAAMAGIYRRLLDRIAEDPAGALSARLSLSRWDKTMVAARSLAGAQR